MEPNLIIKDEGGLDLHPKKTVLNVNSKDFKTKKDRKKNRRTIRQKARNKLTSKTPLKPMIKNISPEEDLDTKSSDDDNDPRWLQFGDAQMPGSGSEDFEESENFDNEEPASSDSEIMFSRPLPDASYVFSLFAGKPRMVLESDSDDDEINSSH